MGNDRIRHVLFDMDGVLIDSETGAFRFLEWKLASRGIHIPFEVLIEKRGKVSMQIAKELIEEYSIPETPEEYQAKNRALGNYYRDTPVLEPFPGLLSFCEALRSRGITMAVVSSTAALSVLYALNRIGMTHYASAIVTGDMVTDPKPAPECYLTAAAVLGGTPSDCVVFEDTPMGIQAGLSAGMRVVGFKGSEIVQDTSRADLSFASYEECLLALDRILSLPPR